MPATQRAVAEGQVRCLKGTRQRRGYRIGVLMETWAVSGRYTSQGSLSPPHLPPPCPLSPSLSLPLSLSLSLCVCVRVCDAQAIQTMLKLQGSTSTPYNYATEPCVPMSVCPVNGLHRTGLRLLYTQHVYGVKTTNDKFQPSGGVLHGKSVALTSCGEYSNKPDVPPELRVLAPLRQSGDSGSGRKPSGTSASGPSCISRCCTAGGVADWWGGGTGICACLTDCIEKRVHRETSAGFRAWAPLRRPTGPLPVYRRTAVVCDRQGARLLSLACTRVSLFPEEPKTVHLIANLHCDKKSLCVHEHACLRGTIMEGKSRLKSWRYYYGGERPMKVLDALVKGRSGGHSDSPLYDCLLSLGSDLLTAEKGSVGLCPALIERSAVQLLPCPPCSCAPFKASSCAGVPTS